MHFLKSRPNDPRFKEVNKLFCSQEERTLIITYIGYLDELERLKSEIEDIFSRQVYIHFMKDNYIEDHYFLEITHIKANKKDGLSLWAKLMGCNEKDVTVFGDNLNLSYESEEREKVLESFGNHTKSKACIYINKLADIDTHVLKDLIKHTVKTYQHLYPNE